MSALPMNKHRWRAAHQLAAELAQRDFDGNLLKTAASYMTAYPDSDLHDWTHRLARLGNMFSSSSQTGRYRHELYEACLRVRPQPVNGRDWALVLAWAARLFSYYNANLEEARAISDVRGLRLPEPPPPFQPPQPATPNLVPEAKLPEVREEVSEEAADYFARLQKLWNKKEE